MGRTKSQLGCSRTRLAALCWLGRSPNLLQVTLPEFELSDQGLLVSLQSRLKPLPFGNVVVVEDDRTWKEKKFAGFDPTGVKSGRSLSTERPRLVLVVPSLS